MFCSDYYPNQTQKGAGDCRLLDDPILLAGAKEQQKHTQWYRKAEHEVQALRSTERKKHGRRGDHETELNNLTLVTREQRLIKAPD